jgi:xanthine/CO dehydrogenase XdhC/CoxF family maturation factor
VTYARRVPFVVATMVRVERPASAKPGDCALLLPDGTLEGFVGGACSESTVRVRPPMLVHVFGQTPVARSLADVGRVAGWDVR